MCPLFNIISGQALLIAAFIGLLFFAPKGIWQTGKKLDKNLAEREEIRERSADARAKETQIVDPVLPNQSSTTNDAFAYAKEKLFRAIDYAIRRHDWYENQRSRIFHQTMTISFAILIILF